MSPTDFQTQNTSLTATGMRGVIAEVWQDVLGCDDLADDVTFFEAGGTSIQLAEAHMTLEQHLGRRIAITVLFETPRLKDLANRLIELPAAPLQNRTQTTGDASGAIAIVGMAGRFPGTQTLDDFWQAIRQGRNLIRHYAPEELEDHVSAETRATPAYVPARPALDGADMFDAKFFNLLPRDAALMDPQARVMLELSQLALDDAGLDPARATGPIGVFAGQATNTYLLENVLPDRASVEDFTSTYQLGDLSRTTGNITDSLATRIAFKLDLKGPAISVSTACSTSLVAIAQAVTNLRAGLVDAALAGGVSITFPQHRGYLAQEGGIASEDGIVRPFDAGANGTVFGHGAGVLVLKRLEDAQDEGDHIYAVIRGVGLNNDGADKIAFTAPSVAGQSAAIKMAHQDAGFTPDTISYVEAHGTATPLGDPIEIAGLTQAFGAGTPDSVALGSVKGNLGHLDAAAGVVSVIKTALMLKNRELPPVANYTTPNPRIDFAAGPFYVPKSLSDWSVDHPLRAGISSFGVGGTNAHIVLEEAPETDDADGVDAMQILPLSAKSPDAVAQMAADLADALEAPDAPDLPDVAFTLQAGRTRHPFRLAVPAAEHKDAAKALRATPAVRKPAQDAPPVIFMFPGQGAQYPGMGSGLYASEPEFARWINRGAEVLQPLLGLDINKLLCFGETSDADAARALRDTRLTQPALYLIEYATAKYWQSKGLHPTAMIGHSVGEFAVAALSGVFDFETGLKIIAARGQLMQDLPGGAMLSVRASLDDLAPHLDATTDLAAMNAPKLQVAAGPFEAIKALEARLEKAGLAFTRLHTSHAFHSAMMDPVVGTLEKHISGVTLNAPQTPYVSCVSGTWITDALATDPSYWAGQARAPVNFNAAITSAAQGSKPVMLEVGAGRTLSAFAGQCLPRDGHGGIIQSLPDHARTETDETAVALAFSKLWSAGVALDFAAFGPRGSNRVPLPGYAFQRKRHWIDSAPSTPIQSAQPIVAAQPECEPPMTASDTPPRKDRLIQELIVLFTDLSGEDLEAGDAAATFLELGFDSLFMGQVSQALAREYGIELTFRSLLADHPSIAALADHLDATLAPDTVAAPAPVMAAAPAAQAVAAPMAPAPLATGAPADLAGLLQAQMQTMQSVFAEQLRAMGGQPATTQPAAAPAPAQQMAPAPAAAPSQEESPQAKSQGFKVGRGPNLSGVALTAEQQAFADDLARQYSEKYKGSKAHSAEYRDVHADPRAVAGFRPEWKELTFPVVCERAKGAYLWDVDGNKFVDLVNGFGQTAFGHSPDFVSDAVNAQMKLGYPIGPQADQAGPVARRFAKMVGHKRVTFCNTGSEAVMAAMRLARTVTGRETIVVFGNDYHGQFDEVLIRGKSRGGEPAALPIAPGIPRSSLKNMVVVPYGEVASLDWVRAHIGDIAAVMVEPVQSRYPEVRPVEFVRELRKITADNGAALIIDEVVTGFRTHPRGMQGLWDIQADMATYGKVVGGGMPIGVLAGDPRFMDALDGGNWSYGDDSKPETAPTYFAGTFVRHPLVLAAVDATLAHMEENGDRLWTGAAQHAQTLAGRMNAALAERGLPDLVKPFSSWFVIKATQHDPRAALLFPLMRMNGVHILDGFCGFLTTEHTDADIAEIERVFILSVDTLQSIGILTGDTAAISAPTHATPPSQAIPLTASQHEIWMTNQLGDMAACSFNEGATLTFTGALDQSRLHAALNKIVARHDGLRMKFAPSGESFKITAPFDLPLPVVDLSAESDPSAAVEQQLKKDARIPVDILSGQPLRAQLLRLSDDKHVLMLTMHHIVCDGWSYNVVFEELAALYRGDDLPAAPSFAAYAQAKSTASGDAETLAFWTDQFRHAPALPELPTDKPRPPIKAFNGSTTTAFISADTMKAVRTAGAKQGCTLFATLFAGLQMTLGRLSGSHEIVLGVPTGGQALLQDQDLVGHCVNFLPIRAAFDPKEPAADHLKRVSQAVMNAFDHQDFTYGTLVQNLDLPRNLNRLPLTEVQFNLEKVPQALNFEGATAHVAPSPKGAANFDLFFNVIESKDGLRIDVDFNADIYSAETVARWVDHYETLLTAISTDSSRAIADLPLVDGSALQRLVEDHNATAMEYDHTARVESMISGAAKSIAAECGDDKITYKELAARTDALAALIQTRLPAPGQRVAVAVHRSIDMLVALIAVHKAGHAYVPLDPRQPDARLQMIVDTAKVAALLTESGTPPAFAAHLTVPVLHPGAVRTGAKPSPHGQSADDTAYVIFTSGSTGTPKGVEIPHRAVANFLHSMAQAPGFTDQDTLLSVTTVSFDIAVLELFLPLIKGGKVVIAKTEDVMGAFPLVERLAQGDITVMQATPTLWDMLLDAGLAPRAGLKILAGGEPLPRDLATRLLAGGAELWNMYGPTETTIWSAIKHITDARAITIGAPIGNTDLHILDPHDHLLPIGVVGELNIGGDGLATGYFNRPDLTDTAFRDVSVMGAARRLYRTGDLARRLPNGEIEVLGRKDTQIKLRGFRIELGEIESRLRALGGIEKAAVDLRTTAAGDPQLVAYVVAQSGATPDTQALATALAAQLPDYMVPRGWMVLPTLPQTQNGKLDRKALPDPTATASAPTARTTAKPKTPTEEKLLGIWSEVLERDDIDPGETLYSLGVDSLMVFRIAARMLAEDLNLEAKHMLAHPSIRALAAFADSREAQPQKARPSLKEFRHGARRNTRAAS